MVRQYHRLNGHEFEHTLGHSEGQGVLESIGSQCAVGPKGTRAMPAQKQTVIVDIW